MRAPQKKKKGPFLALKFTAGWLWSRLQVIADRLVEYFVSVGQMAREWDRVKLHGTVMNTLFRKDTTGEDNF